MYPRAHLKTHTYTHVWMQVLCAHPGVASAAVVGIPHHRLGEQVAALLVLTPGARWDGPSVQAAHGARAERVDRAGVGSSSGGESQKGGGGGSAVSAAPDAAMQEGTAVMAPLSLASLRTFCREGGLAGFKLPQFAAVAAVLPNNVNGKVQKHLAREALAAAAAAGEAKTAAQPPPQQLRSRL